MKPSLTIPILFEDDALVVVAKPAGVVVNRAQSTKAPTLQDWMMARYASDAAFQAALRDGVFAERQGMVHRLDKDTSGVVVFAKTVSALDELLRQFRERETQKEYVALVHGVLREPEGIVRAAIARHPVERERFAVALTGRMSETRYQVQRVFRSVLLESIRPPVDVKITRIYQGFSLIRLWPKTGRTHQIRVHMQFLRHPIVGDARYTGRKRAAADARWCPRQFLHAESLKIKHPVTRQPLALTAELPADLQRVLTLLV